MTKIIKEDDWDRKGTFIKFIMELIHKKAPDEDISRLVAVGKQDYSQDVKISESDIALLYCKLIKEKRTSVVHKLRLIEELVDFKEEYIYHTTYKKEQLDLLIHFPLLAYCIYSQVNWEDIAYIQQLKKIANATNIQVELQKNHWHNQLVKAPLLDFSQVLITYKPYLMMGDAYVDFINNKNNWGDKIKATYTQDPKKVNEYLGYMAKLFISIIQSTPEDEAKLDQDWLKNYAKALRNMTKKVILAINDQRTQTKDEKHQALYEVSQEILLHLDICDKHTLEALDEKTRSKLTDFIQALRKNVNKVSRVVAYTDREFFISASGKLDKKVQTENNTLSFSPN